MNAIDRLRGLFAATGRHPHEPRYEQYGLFDAHTGKRVGKKYRSRSEANAAKNSAKNPHRLRVRGVPAKKQAKGVTV